MAAWKLGDKHSSARALVGLTLLLVLLAAPALLHRINVEKASPIAILVDGREVDAFARATGSSQTQIFARLKEAGVVGVGLHELTLEELAARRPFFAATKATLEAAGSPVLEHLPPALSDRARLFGWRGPIDPWLEASLDAHLPALGERIEAPGFEGALWRLDPGVSLDAVGVGFDPAEASAVREAGLEVVLRPREDQRTPAAIAFLLSQIRAEQPLAVIFWGPAALGYPAHLEQVANGLRSVGSPLGIIEFSVQAGTDYLAKALDYRVLRVHSIAPHEFTSGFDQEAALDRWLRAARERRTALLYVRLPGGSGDLSSDEGPIGATGDDASRRLGQYLAYLEELSGRLVAAGVALGKPVPLAPLPLYLPGIAAAVLGVAAAGALLGAQGWGKGAGWAWLAAAGGVAAFWLLWFKGYTILARQGAAFGAALVFPTLSVFLAARRAEAARAGGPVQALKAGLSSFALATLATLVGSIFLVALLGDVRFLVKLEEFRGVKAAHLLPPLLLAGLFVRPAPGRPWTEWLRTPLRLWHVLLGLAGIGLIAVYLLRTGNDGLPVPAVEDAFRRALEKAFFARPRTKEFLLGHPALLVGLALRTQGKSKLASLLLVIGSIGQVSILNTFAHAHTPLLLSVVRTGYGLLFGLLLGGVSYLLLERAGFVAWETLRDKARRISE